MNYDRARAEEILHILQGELDALDAYQANAAIVKQAGEAYIEANLRQTRDMNSFRKNGSVDWGKDLLLPPIENLTWHPSLNHLRAPIDHAERTIEKCEVVKNQIRCAILEIQSEIAIREEKAK